MLLAKDNFSSESKKERPIVPRRLTPEEVRQKELLQMVSQANNQILIRKNSSENGTNEVSAEDVKIVPLGSKKISLGESNVENIAKKGTFKPLPFLKMTNLLSPLIPVKIAERREAKSAKLRVKNHDVN